MALAAVTISARPADGNHPYGHSKVEYLSAVTEGVLIVLAAGLILKEAAAGFMAPRALDAPETGMAINLVATLIYGLWAALLLRKGRRWRSPALIADGRHIMADVVTSVGVLAGVLAASLTGYWILDPILAGAVGLNILWSGWVLIRGSVGGLMDEAVPDDLLAQIREVVRASAGGAIEVHDFRTRHAGPVTFIEFHLIVPGTMSVSGAHDICDRVERALADEIPGCSVSIHVEPEYKAKPGSGLRIDAQAGDNGA
jgi:cation diffusion facilitator family transporter